VVPTAAAASKSRPNWSTCKTEGAGLQSNDDADDIDDDKADDDN